MQTKTEVEKRIFSFWMASLITFFIFGIWLFNLTYLNNGIDFDKKNIQNEASSISSNIASSFQELKNLLNFDK